MEVIKRKEAIKQNLKFYFTDAPCKRGHIEKRYTKTGECVECVRLRAIAFQKEHKESIKLNNKRWYENNKDHMREYIREYLREYRRKNRKAHNERNKQWIRNNIEKHRISDRFRSARRRARKLQATPIWSEWEEIKKLYVFAAKSEGNIHVDHVLPLQGDIVCGLHVLLNLQLLDSSANSGKKNKINQDLESSYQTMLSQKLSSELESK